MSHSDSLTDVNLPNSHTLVDQMVDQILNIAFYRFFELSDLDALRASLKEVCIGLELKGCILLSPEGVNGFLAGTVLQIREFQKFFATLSVGAGMDFKESYSDTLPFKRMLVKVKGEIIPAGFRLSPEEQTNSSLVGKRISAKELKQWLDEGKNFILLDTRNKYEIEYGTFKKAKHLGMRHFRNFKEKFKLLAQAEERVPLVMFCTGGIRCEKASKMAVQQGYADVYQLDGGILKYFEECGAAHYEGNCFVFDQRIAVDASLKVCPGAADVFAE